ncbi:hypothetical protein [Peribacillus huizhouensis]|uniref:Lipoprotein n=1 Tax=Peribacillus huizhouensis TaxID=1501239 RepID=A0ABR6CTE1_9BACI|nr:hypothetical protein [Peribacillus huizhouensis]MBA9027612.1 hypothetical protein [Peribacillus huizhouensis]
MKKMMLSIIIVFGLSTVINVCTTNSVIVAEAKQEEKTLFDKGWKNFKKKWEKAMNPNHRNLSIVEFKGKEESYPGMFYKGEVRSYLFVGAETKSMKSKKFRSVSVVGFISPEKQNSDYNTLVAGVKLIQIANPNISIEMVKEIAYGHLGLGEEFLVDGTKKTYSYKGVKYTAEYTADDKHPDNGIFTLTVEKE